MHADDGSVNEVTDQDLALAELDGNVGEHHEFIPATNAPTGTVVPAGKHVQAYKGSPLVTPKPLPLVGFNPDTGHIVINQLDEQGRRTGSWAIDLAYSKPAGDFFYTRDELKAIVEHMAIIERVAKGLIKKSKLIVNQRLSRDLLPAPLPVPATDPTMDRWGYDIRDNAPVANVPRVNEEKICNLEPKLGYKISPGCAIDSSPLSAVRSFKPRTIPESGFSAAELGGVIASMANVESEIERKSGKVDYVQLEQQRHIGHQINPETGVVIG